jgi:diguanylate cyclase (GGDEF)-like protein/PAS domain S-box-containing protein
LGYRADEVIGKKHFYDIHPEEGREAFKTAALEIFARKEPFKNLENIIQTKDGHIVWVSTNGVPIIDNKGVLLGYRGSDTDINERKQVESALRESDERFYNAFEYAAIGMALISLEGSWLKVNQALCDIIGYSKNELLQKTFQDITHPDDLGTDLLYVQKMLSGTISTYKMEKRYYHKLGHIVCVLLAVSMVRDSMENPLYFISQIEDITERKRAEEALAKIEEKQNAMISNISDVIGIIRLDGIIEYKSPNIEKYFGWHPQDLIGADCWLTVHPDDLERVQRHFYALLESDHSVVEIEYQYKCKDGSYKPVRLTATNLVNDPIISGVLLNYHDITDRKLAEDALLDGERRYRLLWESASEGFGLHELITNADGVAVNYRILDVNPVFESITGLTADQVVGKLATEAYRTKEPPYLEVYARVATTGIAEYFETHFGPTNMHFEISVFSPSPGQFATAFSDISERKAHEAMLSYQSTHDALTSLPNRLFFERHLGDILNDNAGRRLRSMGVFFLDLDNFKMVNDTMGHKAGDELLKEAAVRLSKCLRAGDILARIGGDEFTILLHDIWAKDDAAIVAQRILQTIAQPFEVAGCKLVIGVSIGVSIYPDNAVDVDGLLKSADAAMYKAKELGRNNCQFFSDEISQANQARVEMERDLRYAIELDELKVFYQPITDIRTMRITGAEALLRWEHPEQGMISPGLFVPLAEETGLILPMGRMVLETACKQGKAWHEAGYSDFEISVNVSPAQLSDIGFISEVHAALSDSGFPPNCLKLEVTETVIARNDNDEVDILSILKSLGVSICLDDFGIGYSSLSRLNKLPIAHMKIDGYFVRNITCSQKDRAMTESIIVMAHNLGIKVTAEWIEDEDQMEIIKSLNCDYAQGYLISPALSADNFSNFLKAWTNRRQSTNAA